VRRMEIGTPSWNRTTQSYTFSIYKCPFLAGEVSYYEGTLPTELPATTQVSAGTIVQEILEKTKKYFTNPLSLEKVLRVLRHTIHQGDGKEPSEAGWYRIEWRPCAFVVKAGDYTVAWKIEEMTQTDPVIPAEFTATTPRAQSPEQVPEQTRSIQIHDSLIPVGDLPLSDLPPLSFAQEEMDPLREESRRRIREARLKVALAKLKAQRMEQRFYERYGQAPEDSEEESSDLTSESEADSFEPHSQ
jgi:hypothetical protein